MSNYTTINKSTEHFNTKLYEGNGSTNAITGVGFQPDLTWIKNRTDVSNHNLYDAVRGTSAGKLKSNTTNAESYNASDLSTFGTDGFTVGGNNEVNGSSDNMVSWNWKAGGAVSGNTTGSGTSKSYTGSINSTAKFSIIRYQGNGTAGHTIPHRLSTTPAMIIVKNISASWNWSVYHKDAFTSQSSPGVLYLNTTAAKANDTNVWGNSTVTINSTVFSLGDYQGTNNNNDYFIAYCFAEKTGYSKFGSYTGNGSSDGTFVYTGFKPAWVLYKRTDSGADWHMYDNKRDVDNAVDKTLFPSGNYAESAGDALDFLSNGFKQRNTGAEANASGGTYLFMAFAEHPFVTAGTKAAGTAR